MSIKIEILQPCGSNPPFLILNDKDIYPIIDIFFNGETDHEFPTYQEPFTLLTGTLSFVDIFNQCHYIVNVSDQNLEDIQETLWKKRVKKLKDFSKEIGKKPESDNSKFLPPWYWNNIPEDDWPSWMLN